MGGGRGGAEGRRTYNKIRNSVSARRFYFIATKTIIFYIVIDDYWNAGFFFFFLQKLVRIQSVCCRRNGAQNIFSNLFSGSDLARGPVLESERNKPIGGTKLALIIALGMICISNTFSIIEKTPPKKKIHQYYCTPA